MNGIIGQLFEDAQKVSQAYLDRSQYLLANALTTPPNLRDLGLTAKCVIIDEPKTQEDEELRLSRILERDELFRFAYVPFVIAQLVWDYADTILDISIRLRIHETKRLCRAVRELRREYDQIRAPYIDKKHQKSEEDNMLMFEDGVRGIMSQMVLNLSFDLKSEYPDIDSEYLMLLIAVYECDITLRALLLYTERQRQMVAKKIDRTVGRILPRPIYNLKDIVIEFVGDKPVSQKFSELKQKYIETFANQMGLIELNELPTETENE